MIRKEIAACVLAVLILLLAGCSGAQESSPQSFSVTETTAVQSSKAGSHVDASWFDDAVFVGDSVTLKLMYYCEEHPEALSDAQFFCAGSLGYASALWDLYEEGAVHPYYKGNIALSEDCAVETGATKVFIMLGMNDLAVYGTDGTLEYADELIKRILSKSPGVSIYIQSVTPILPGHETDDLTNEIIREFNSKLEKYSEKMNYRYLDIYSQMQDETGYLKAEYCGDEGAQGIHFTDLACALWADYLKENCGG